MPRPKTPQPPWRFTNASLIPTNPHFELGKFTPKDFKAWCWQQSPPLCSECGTPYVRPGRPDYFCSSGCTSRWTDRLSGRPFLPVKYRNQDWPGKAAGELPPEIQSIRDMWNTGLDGTRNAIVVCGANCYGYPTNEWPMVEDRRGHQCQLPAGWQTEHPGTGKCRFHAGLTKQSNIKAQRENLLEKAKVNEMIYGTPVEEIDPGAAVLQELARTAGHVQWLYEKMQEVETEYGQDAALQQSTKMGRTPAVWIDLYYRERQHLLTVAKTAASMGIQERQIRMAEEQGRLLADVIRAFMNDPDLGLSPEQMVRAPELMRRHLAAIPMKTEPRPQAPSIVLQDGMIADAPRDIEVAIIVDDYDDDPED